MDVFNSYVPNSLVLKSEVACAVYEKSMGIDFAALITNPNVGIDAQIWHNEKAETWTEAINKVAQEKQWLVFNFQTLAPEPLDSTSQLIDVQLVIAWLQEIGLAWLADKLNEILKATQTRYCEAAQIKPQGTSENDCSQEPKAPKQMGVSKQEILAVSWPIPSGAPLMEKILHKIPKWVETACEKTGSQGRGSHLWNPASLAICLASTTPQKQWKSHVTSLDAVITKHFPEYEPQWEKAKELGF